MKKTVLLFFIFTISKLCFAQVGISTTSPHISAELDVSSTTRGLLLPRLTTAAITSLSTTASEGLIVFDTDKKVFLGWNGTKWQVFGNLATSVILAGWDTSSLGSTFGPSPFSASTLNELTSATLNRGSGLTATGSAAANTYGANGFDLGATTLLVATTTNDFFTINLIIPSNKVISLTSIGALSLLRTGAGPTSFQWQFSTDGSTFTNIGTGFTIPGTATVINAPVNLTAISSLQNLTSITVTFRLVGFNATAITGNFYFQNGNIGDDIVITGTSE